MKTSLQQIFKEFLNEAEFVNKLRPATLQGYRQSFNTLLRLMPGISIQTLTPIALAQFFRILEERKRLVGKGEIRSGIKKSTAATYWNKLGKFFRWLLIKKYIKENPFTGLRFPTPSYEDKKFLKREEVEKIITTIHNNYGKNLLLFKRNLVLFYLLIFCGLRKEELSLLQIPDVDFERRILKVRAETSKSGRSREIPLHSTTLMHLKDYLRLRTKYTTQYLLVSAGRDDRISYEGIKHLVNKIRRQSGVRFHLHQFRHTFAINFLKTSNNLAKLKQLLGHKDIRMTMIYLRCLPVDEMREDVERMSIEKFI